MIKEPTILIIPEGKKRLQIPLSLVKGVRSNSITEYSNLSKIIDQMTDNKNQSLINFSNELKAAKKQDAKLYKELKEGHCLGFIVGRYAKRFDNSCEVYVPLLGFDVDGIEDELYTDFHLNQCQKSPYIFLAFPSPSGKGLRVFIWCDTTLKNHKKTYVKACNYLSDFLKIPTDKMLRNDLKAKGLDDKEIRQQLKVNDHIDTSTKNPSRIWFYSHVSKSDLWLNLNSEIFALPSNQTVKPDIQKPILRPQTNSTARQNNAPLDLAEKIRLCELMAEQRNVNEGRNNHVFTLACLMYEHGIDKGSILNYCFKYEQEDFNAHEIKKTVNSAANKATFQKFTDKQLLNWRNRVELKQEQQPITIPLYQPKNADDILEDLLKGFTRIDFREKANLDANQKLLLKHYIVTIVEEVLEQAKNRQYGLCRVHDFVYLYNGCYWENIDKDELKTFLGESAIRLGYKKIEAKYFEVRDKLYKQFLSSGNFTKQKRNNRVTLINLKNGTFELGFNQSRLRPFEMNDFLTYQLPFNYNPNANCPTFDQYIKRVLPDESCQKVLAEYIGYVFIRGLKLEKCLLLYGSGANGKSVFFDIVNALLGSENISNFSLGNLKEENNRALINNKLLNYGSEIKGDIESDVFKQLVSGEPIQARLKYGNSFIMTNYAKLAFNCNTLPKDIEHNEAYFRRFLIIPFEVTIPAHERDPELSRKIISNELSGVFNWVLKGLKRILKQKKFTKSDAVQKALQRYRKESDTVQLFLEDAGYVKSATQSTLLKNLYFQYKTFCVEDGYKALGKRNFNKRLEVLNLFPARKNKGIFIPVCKK